MIQYYTDSAKKSLWVLSEILSFGEELDCLTCFSADKDSGFHVGQRINNPKLQNSNWQPLDGELIPANLISNV